MTTATATSRRTVADVERELAEFKAKVRETALAAKASEGWCDDGFNQAMRELGLPEKKKYVIRIEIVSKRLASVEVTDADSEEEARAQVTAMSADALADHIDYRGTYVSHTVPVPADANTVVVGDDDPTGGDTMSRQTCRTRHSGWICTRERGHSGQHVAGNSTRVVDVWPNQPADFEYTA